LAAKNKNTAVSFLITKWDVSALVVSTEMPAIQIISIEVSFSGIRITMVVVW